MDRIKPPRLKPGDTIGVVSPASRPGEIRMLRKGVKYLESLGYHVKLGPHVLNQRGYLAGEDKRRIADLHSMFGDPEVNAIFCSRGGYGSPRLLHQLDYDLIRNNPKIFIGYSDITALNMAFFKQAGLVNFSGPMVAVECGRGIEPFTEKSLWHMLASGDSITKIVNPEGEKIKIVNSGKASGLLMPVCFSVLHGILGTPYVPDFTGTILVLEDINEEPYRLDRYFSSLKASGILDKLAALVLGQFIDCESHDADKPSLTVHNVLKDYLAELSIPVLSGLAYGHGAVKMTMPIGIRAEIDTRRRLFSIVESTVKGT
ncbi:LD-carboxypeptidase [candidate division KSB1 bacterium]|nr:LD-carboxypeptidase [candidate division KSB1 bacterium]